MSNILIVEDEAGVRESLNAFLSGEGHHIDMAANGLEAIKFFESQNYDLVLTDIMMPGMDGLTLLKEIKDKLKSPASVIMLTAFGTVQQAVTAVQAGAVDFVMKPFEVERLRDAVNKALQHDRKVLKHELHRKDAESKQLKLLNERLDRKVFELAILYEIGKTVNSSLELNKIISIILEMSRQTVNAERGTLVLYFPHTHEIKLHLTYSAGEEQPGQALRTYERSVLEWVTLNQQAMFIEDFEKPGLFQQYLGPNSKLGSLLAIPLKRKAQILGALLLSNPKGGNHFVKEDLRFISTLANQAAIAIENGQLVEEMQDYFADTLRALIAAVEAKETFTTGHSVRVTRYALMIAKKINLNPVEKRRLEYLTLLHDIGKISVDDKILRKETKLNLQEWEMIKNHAMIGGSIIKPIKFLPNGHSVIRHHHERYNGSGYPDGLTGDAIPLFSRIIAVADSFDAMTTLRPYRPTLKSEEALKELQKCSGHQFDPKLVDCFVKAYQEGTLAV